MYTLNPCSAKSLSKKFPKPHNVDSKEYKKNKKKIKSYTMLLFINSKGMNAGKKKQYGTAINVPRATR